MGRLHGATSVNFYHYKLEYLNDDREVYKTEFYKTSKEVQQLLGVGDTTIYRKISDPNYNARKKELNNINFLKCREPVFKKERVRIEY